MFEFLLEDLLPVVFIIMTIGWFVRRAWILILYFRNLKGEMRRDWEDIGKG